MSMAAFECPPGRTDIIVVPGSRPLAGLILLPVVICPGTAIGLPGSPGKADFLHIAENSVSFCFFDNAILPLRKI